MYATCSGKQLEIGQRIRVNMPPRGRFHGLEGFVVRHEHYDIYVICFDGMRESQFIDIQNIVRI